LEEVTQMTGLALSAPISKLLLAVERIPHISSAIERCDLQAAAAGFARIATLEKEAYTMLAKLFIDT
jgi:hypothetical protein